MYIGLNALYGTNKNLNRVPDLLIKALLKEASGLARRSGNETIFGFFGRFLRWPGYLHSPLAYHYVKVLILILNIKIQVSFIR